MNDILIQRLCEGISDNLQSTLIFGGREKTKELLGTVYEYAKGVDTVLAVYVDSSKIKTPKDFFECILKQKYDILTEEQKIIVDSLCSGKLDLDADTVTNAIHDLVALCGRQNKESKHSIIFIDGIDNLFFNLDYGHLDAESIERLLKDNAPHHSSSMIITSFRAYRDEYTELSSFFYGTVWNRDSKEYKLTLENYHYPFNAMNFSIREI